MRAVRDVLLFSGGLLGTVYSVFFHMQPALLTLFGAMMMLPVTLHHHELQESIDMYEIYEMGSELPVAYIERHPCADAHQGLIPVATVEGDVVAALCTVCDQQLPASILKEGCDCTELCSMGPTCPGGMLAGLPGAGCWRTDGA